VSVLSIINLLVEILPPIEQDVKTLVEIVDVGLPQYFWLTSCTGSSTHPVKGDT
jgi:hypothetical protein